VRPDQPLARLLHGNRVDVRGFVPENELRRLRLDTRARFVPDDLYRSAVSLHLEAVESTAAEVVAPAMLSSLHGGPIASRQDEHGRAIPVSSQFAVRFRPDETPGFGLPMQVSGEVIVSAEGESLASLALRRLWRIVMSELKHQ
jgi:putative peptide zinc metalloprotease protein